ncbi:MAG: CvpA family protein [Nevskiaceae bacterium]|jgi:membrane protein required for colicin V production|nr:MAG: CvpA family protein [Nevskiaceae bacterium]TAM28827.1 MAG: CvpA family protein [Nevskiaceae bacterium]
MNWADYAILTIVLVSILVGIFRGLTRELLGLVGWVLAFWLAFHFVDPVSAWLDGRIATPSVRRAVAFGGIFLLTLLLCAIATFLLASMIRDSQFSGIDRTLGGGFGFLRGLLLIAALLMVAGTTTARQDLWWRQSLLVPELEWLAEALHSVLPESWIRALESPNSPSEPAVSRQGRSS